MLSNGRLSLTSSLARAPVQRVVPFLDRHLAIPYVGHLNNLEPLVPSPCLLPLVLAGQTTDMHLRFAHSSLFPEASITAAQYELVKKTNMVDYMGQLFEQVHPGKPSPFGASAHSELD